MKMKHSLATVLFILVLGLSAPVFAQEGHEEAARAYFARDFEQALKIYTPMAEKGDAEAQFNLGIMYQHGQGTKMDNDAANKWFIKSAEAGNPAAMSKLGEIFREGRGVKKDDKQAAEWFAKAADEGHPGAMNNLAYLYYLGEGVKQDFNIARVMFERAAEKDVADAQYNLATMYDEGKGVKKADPTTAAGWFLKSAAQGNVEAQFALGFMAFTGRGLDKDKVEAYKWLKLAVNGGKEEAVKGLATVTVDMSKEEIARGDKLAEDWKPKGVQ